MDEQLRERLGDEALLALVATPHGAAALLVRSAISERDAARGSPDAANVQEGKT